MEQGPKQGPGNRPNRRQFLGMMGMAGSALAASPLLAACGGTSGSTAGEGGSAASTAPLKVGMVGDVNTFSPFELTRTNYVFTANIYDTLLRYNSSLKPTPRLADKWSVGQGNTSITLTLRPGLTFQSGSPVDAEAVVKNFQYAAQETTGDNLYSFAQYVRSATAVSSSEVRLDFKQPLPTQAITDIVTLTSIIDPAAMSKLEKKGVGAGPFAFDSWVPNTSLDLSKFSKYWQRSLPELTSIDWTMFSDEVAMVRALQSGSLDVATYISFQDASSLKNSYDLVVSPHAPQVYEIRVNPTHAPFTSQSVRQGLQYAIDRKGIVNSVLWGYSQPTVLPFGTTSPAYDASAAAEYPFDLTKAKQMFAAGGAADWSAEIMVTNDYPETVTMAELLAADLKKIGVNLKVDVEDITTYDTRLTAGDFTLCGSFAGVGNEYPLWMTLSSDYRVVDNPLWGGKVPASYSSAMTSVANAVTASQEKAAFAALRDSLLTESWVIDIAYYPSITAVAKGVAGVGYTVNDWLTLESAQRTA